MVDVCNGRCTGVTGCIDYGKFFRLESLKNAVWEEAMQRKNEGKISIDARDLGV